MSEIQGLCLEEYILILFLTIMFTCYNVALNLKFVFLGDKLLCEVVLKFY